MAYDNFTDDLKAQLNIVDIIGRVVTLKKSGSNYMGLCPFHTEKTPSFSVNEGKQFYHCFGCGKSGDVIGFVQEYYKLPFMEAVEKLATENGIKLPERSESPIFFSIRLDSPVKSDSFTSQDPFSTMQSTII